MFYVRAGSSKSNVLLGAIRIVIVIVFYHYTITAAEDRTRNAYNV